MAKLRLNINGMEVTGFAGQTILQIAEESGIEIPTLCHDERVNAYGACGLCIVEVEGIPKLLRSCATEITDGMIIKTNTERVRASRKLALELLLSDHVGDCRPPCVLSCPGHTDCQGYVGLIANKEYGAALELIKEQLPLPASIGRICPHPCEDACRRRLVEEPVSIASLKSFVADLDLKNPEVFIPELKPPTNKKVGIIGGGPGGLSCAYFLAREGHKVTIYDAMPQMGGMLRYGIPEYRLPKNILDKEISIIEKMGVKLINNVRIGKDVTLDFIRNRYDAVYVAIGAWRSSKMGCAGETAKGVIGSTSFLKKVSLNERIKIGSRVAVVGGGNTAMDACRTAVRLGAKEVYLLYRRTEEEMPAEAIEIKEAREEGVIFKFLVAPIEIVEADGKAAAIRLQKMQSGAPDKSGRRSSIPIEGEEEILPVDTVISAIGQIPNIDGLEDLKLTRRGTIRADENTFATSISGIFAGGDVINKGASIAIKAIGDAKKAAASICSYLAGKHMDHKKPYFVERKDLTAESYKDKPRVPRVHVEHLSAEERKDNFHEINFGLSEEAAVKEAKRCLECGCHDVFECKLIAMANQYDVNPQRIAGEAHKREFEDNHPYVLRNPDKCILCGLCVRMCDEVMGIAALGLTERGFDSIVKPSLNRPLMETGCICCGQCVSVCPTGALQERLNIEKSVPLELDNTHTVCSLCSIGCNVNLKTKGSMLVRSMPVNDNRVDDALLCVKGRFGIDVTVKGTRLRKPLIRRSGVLVEASFEDALVYIGKKIQSLTSIYGNESIGVSVSDSYTNEEIFLARKLAAEAIKTNKIYCLNGMHSGLMDVLGYDASTNALEELKSTDTIILVGSDILKEHVIVGLKVKQAIKKGAKLITINSRETVIDKYAHISLKTDKISILKEITKHLLNMNCTAHKNVSGLEKLKASLTEVEVSREAAEIAELYTKSKKAMIVFAQNNLSAHAVSMLANMAVISGHIGKPRSGIIQLKSNSNSQGLVDMGVSTESSELLEAIESGAVKGMLIFGEDVEGIDLDKLDFLMVQDTHLTKTAEQADVVLPAIGFAESRGTITSTERRIQQLRKAIAPISGIENWDILMKLCTAFGLKMSFNSPEEIFVQISKEIPLYKNAVSYIGSSLFWPIGGSPVLYEEGFATESGCAVLKPAGDGELFISKTNTNHLVNDLTERLKKQGIIK